MTAHSTGIQLANLPPNPRAASKPTNSSPTHQYYQSFPAVCRKFRDLDSDAVYEECKVAIMNEATNNFIVDFGGAAEGGGAAWCALNLDDSPATVEAVKGLLGKERPRELRTRWINIFSPHTQQPLVRAIAQHYGLSSRHTSALVAPPQRVEPVQKKPVQHQQQILERFRNSLHHRGRDVENVADGIDGNSRLAGGNVTPPRQERQGYMDLVSSVWHWHAVEWGGRFMCIGFNLLHQIPDEGEDSSNGDEDTDYEDDWDWSGDKGGKASMDKGENYPQGKRLWSWLVLCDDGTVLALHEPTGNVSENQMKLIRKNMFTVFRSLSQSPKARDEARNSYDLNSGLEEMPFRRVHTEGDKKEDIDSAPSLLFYYLFDDWYSSINLVIGRGDPYSIHMSNLRQEMQRDPKLSHISRLHRLARQLATLKRMYETKKIIIDNVLYRQENSLYDHTSVQSSSATNSSPNDPSLTLGDSNILGVPLSPIAVAKFERLRDRVKLYALGEIEACLEEKTELISMVFNLLAMKESRAVERLSRVAIFLTKFTFLFLPLTLITGYFSMQLKDMGDYTQGHFWAASGIFVALMVLMLYTVGKSTDTLETGVIWNSVKETWFPCLGKKKKKKRGGTSGVESY